MDSVTALRQLRQRLPAPTPQNVNLREDMLTEARKLMIDLERPDNTLLRIGYQLVESVTVNAAVKMGLFRVINNCQSKSTEEIARECGADPILAGMILRCLAANGAVQENGSDSYSPNAISRTFSDRKNIASLTFCLDFIASGWLAMPKFLEERNWTNPADPLDTPIAKAWNSKDSMWTILASHPAHESGMLHMESFSLGHKAWTDVYPIAERHGAGAKADSTAVMMVDVGGGLGHQAINTKRNFPELPGKYIVQDLAQAFPPSDQRPTDVEFMEHDFRNPQPIKGARVYYFRFVMHDWPQQHAIDICAQTRKAMQPGYSKLILNEYIVPDVGATRRITNEDMNMLNGGSGMERTEALHRDCLEKAELKITGIFYPGDRISAAVIEAEVA
ncbi:MAG: hypothetical protein Q9227_006652 [Pyrenula ochraceoflavens]